MNLDILCLKGDYTFWKDTFVLDSKAWLNKIPQFLSFELDFCEWKT